VKTHPQTPILHEYILDPHRERSPDTHTTIDHQANQCTVAHPSPGVVMSIEASKARASSGASTGVLPRRMLCDGPRTEIAGLCCTTWVRTNQSNRCRTLASRCFTVGTDTLRPSSSIYAATCNGWIWDSAVTWRAAHHARKSAHPRA
jgi:hypothetical protein